MPNPNVGLGAAPVWAANGDVVCGFLYDPYDGSLENVEPTTGAVIEDSTYPNDNWYECDDSSLLSHYSINGKICMTYDRVELMEENGNFRRFLAYGCKFKSFLCEQDFYVYSDRCFQCPQGKTAMSPLEKLTATIDGLSNRYYHNNTSCNYCADENQYLNGSTCTNCPTSDWGNVFAHGGTGITSCHVGFNWPTQTGRDATGTYEIEIRPDGEVMYDDESTGYREMLFYCKYRA